MSGTELTTMDGLSAAELAALTGQQMFSAGDRGPQIPRLSINKNFEDRDGKEIPPKTFTFEHPEFGRVYLKNPELRVLISGHQYMHYDEEATGTRDDGSTYKGKYVNRTIIFRDWKEEAVDIKGGVRCGKKKYSKREYDALNEAEKKAHKAIKLYMHIFAVIRGDAILADGSTQEIDWTLVHWRINGQNKDAMFDGLKEVSSQKKAAMNIAFRLPLRREQTGENVYYVAEPKPDMTYLHEVDDNVFAAFRTANDFIEDTNKFVRKKYDEALREAVGDDMSFGDEDLDGMVGDDPFDKELDDEIPF